MRYLWLCALLVISDGSKGPSARTAAAPPSVTVRSGKIEGATTNGVDVYKGVPFAKPPVGKLRWQPPLLPDSWQGIHSAKSFAHDCMQLPAPSEAAPAGSTTPSEDCLYLNVWAPWQTQPSGLPVMVWIHGGGFLNGGSSTPVYDGRAFARSGVVLVTFNYRLGRFGFFAHPALTAEQPNGPFGNYAFMDQLAVLRWVRLNINAFGGDPSRVTVFGESAGGSSVLTLMTSPKGVGLFSQAIVQSGGGRDSGRPRFALNRDTHAGAPESGESLGQAFARSKGIAGEDKAALDALRGLSAEEIVDGLNFITRRAGHASAATFAGPMLDGEIVAERPQAVYEAGGQMKVPLLIGANNNDLAYPQGRTVDELLAVFGAQAVKARLAYDPENANNVHDVGTRVASDRSELEPARHVARTLATQGQRVYLYRFSYVANCMDHEWVGAPHASEVPFVFNTVRARYGLALTQPDEWMAQTTLARWVAFASTGRPDLPGQPVWPAFDPRSEEVLEFTKRGLLRGRDPLKERLDLTEGTYPSKTSR